MSDQEDLAPESFKCPVCGERRMDWLAWVDDETLECSVCHARYRPTDEPKEPSPFSEN
jgi:rubredoxin